MPEVKNGLRVTAPKRPIMPWEPEPVTLDARQLAQPTELPADWPDFEPVADQRPNED